MDLENILNMTNNKLKYNIEYYEEIESTHLLAKNLKKEDNNKKIIIANKQISGIGTNGRIWHTGKDKNIAMTVIIYPKCQIQKLKNFTIEIAKFLKKGIKELYNYDLEIKEPNDLTLNNKKICGILTETLLQKSTVKILYISIGFNVNEENFPDSLNYIATSLKKEYNKEFEREEIIAKFIDKIEELLNKYEIA